MNNKKISRRDCAEQWGVWGTPKETRKDNDV